MGPGKKSFGERFAEAFEKAASSEHEEYEKMPKKYEPGEGVMEVVEPNGESHFEVD